MPTQKVRFTLWMDPDFLRAAKLRASEEGVAPSRVIAAAARTVLIDAQQNADAKLLQAVERVLILIQRIDRKRVYDQQVLKEMVGLMVLSFFNHTPALPEKDRKAALYSGKARFNKFLDALAANLRAGESILNDLPASHDPPSQDQLAPKSATTKAESSITTESVSPPVETQEQSAPPVVERPPPIEPVPANDAPPEKPLSTAEPRSRWKLF
jgi:hypothetical protein